MELYSFSFIIWFIHYVNSHSTPCGNQHTPVLRICSNSKLVKDTTVYITTTSVPLLQQTLCKCSINTTISLVNISFSFIEDMLPQSLSFKVNDNEVMSGLSTFTLMDKSMALSVLTSENYTSEGACLKVHSDTPFNVICYRTPADLSTTNTTPLQDDSHPQSSVDPNKYISNKTDKNESQITTPVVASVAAIVCLVFVIVIVIVFRRKSANRKKQPKMSNQTFTNNEVDEDEDDYYMTENPMYQRGPHTVKNTDKPNDEYHYIEPDKQSNDVQTDGSKRFPNLKQIQGNIKTDDDHYEYSTCVSSSQKRNPSAEKKSRHNKINSAPNENTYDTTDKVSTRQFKGFNEYHQLSKVGQMNVAVVDIYNTIGNTSEYPNEENQERDSDYHVTKTR